MDIQITIQNLREELNQHNHNYYVLDQPTISDFEFDVKLKQLQDLKIDWIILAGFLRKIPEELITQYPKKIINLHPSLLPSFGGKGMYGDFVHQAVLASGTDRSGITIHYVNEEFDKGEIIAQFTCRVDREDTASMLSAKIHLLEQQHFPLIIEKTISE